MRESFQCRFGCLSRFGSNDIEKEKTHSICSYQLNKSQNSSTYIDLKRTRSIDRSIEREREREGGESGLVG